MVGVARRSVLRGVAVSALLPLAASMSAAGSAGAGAPRSVGVGVLARAALEAAVGAPVRVVGAAGAGTATLERVDDLRRAPAGHPDAFTVRFALDGDGAAVLDGLVDIELPSVCVTGVGLLLADVERRTAVLMIDRRPVSEHLAAITSA